MTTATRATERDEQLTQLREWLKPGDTVYTILRHVSASGMSRSISLKIFRDGRDGCEPLQLDYAAEVILGLTRDKKHNGVKMGGVGSDMGFEVVYHLSEALYGHDSPDGYECAGDRCPSNAHSNYRGPRDEEPRGVGIRHHDGYALNQRWL